MKITQLKKKECSPALITINTDILIENIRTGTKSKPVSAFREQLKYALPGEHCNAVERLPKILPAAEFKKDGDGILMKTYNGLVELSIGTMSGKVEIFHAHAYCLAVKCYQPQFPFDILPKEPRLDQYSRLSFDPDVMYRPDSV